MMRIVLEGSCPLAIHSARCELRPLCSPCWPWLFHPLSRLPRRRRRSIRSMPDGDGRSFTMPFNRVRGVVASVFGDDLTAEGLLRSVIVSSPHSEQAYESFEWLTHIYFRNGRYRTLMANMEA